MSLNERCTSLLRVPVSEMTYTVSSGTLNSTIPYHTLFNGQYHRTTCLSWHQKVRPFWVLLQQEIMELEVMAAGTVEDAQNLSRITTVRMPTLRFVLRKYVLISDAVNIL